MGTLKNIDSNALDLHMRKLVKKKFTGQIIVTAPCDEVVVVEEDTINTFDRRMIDLCHTGGLSIPSPVR